MTTDDLNDEQPEEPGRLRQMYEESAKRAAAAETQLAELTRRETFRAAGLDPADKLHAAASKAYDGEMDPVKVREWADDLGLIKPPPSPEPAPNTLPPAATNEIDALARISQAVTGEAGPPPTPERREQLRTQLMDAIMRNAGPQEIDRLSTDFSRAGGYVTAEDIRR